jgi:hypothetical protein
MTFAVMLHQRLNFLNASFKASFPSRASNDHIVDGSVELEEYLTVWPMEPNSLDNTACIIHVILTDSKN